MISMKQHIFSIKYTNSDSNSTSLLNGGYRPNPGVAFATAETIFIRTPCTCLITLSNISNTENCYSCHHDIIGYLSLQSHLVNVKQSLSMKGPLYCIKVSNTGRLVHSNVYQPNPRLILHNIGQVFLIWRYQAQ